MLVVKPVLRPAWHQHTIPRSLARSTEGPEIRRSELGWGRQQQPPETCDPGPDNHQPTNNPHPRSFDTPKYAGAGSFNSSSRHSRTRHRPLKPLPCHLAQSGARTQARFPHRPDWPDPQSQSLSRSYGSNLPTSLTYISLSTRGFLPWRPDADMGTRMSENRYITCLGEARFT